MEAEITRFRILMFPWLAHGHIFPFLELARRILKRKRFFIYLATTAINFSSAKNFIEKNILDDCIELVELNLELNPELPPHYHTTKNLPSNLNLTLLKAFQTSKSSFSKIIDTLKPNLVIYDIFQPWTPKIASSQGIPAVYFSTYGAALLSYIHHHYSCPKDATFPFPQLCPTDYAKENIDRFIEFLCAYVYEGDRDIIFLNFKLSCDFLLVKTSTPFEGNYIDYISSERQKEVVPVGPLVSDATEIDEENSEIMQWLSKKDEYSTLYICFGSENFLTKQEIEEIARALELCDDRVNFMWVIRFPVGEKAFDIEEALPHGFRERMKERGMIVEGWAPQANILAHKSTGGFMSHCGWSSVNESVYFGVPVIGMPIKLDMFIEARMLVASGACVEVPRDESNVFEAEEIAKAINKVIVEVTRERLRSRAQELRDNIRKEEEPAMDEAAEKLWQLCLKNKLE